MKVVKVPALGAFKNTPPTVKPLASTETRLVSTIAAGVEVLPNVTEPFPVSTIDPALVVSVPVVKLELLVLIVSVDVSEVESLNNDAVPTVVVPVVPVDVFGASLTFMVEAVWDPPVVAVEL